MRAFISNLIGDTPLGIGQTKDLPESAFISVAAAAAHLGVTGITIRRALDRGQMRKYRIGRKILIRRDEFRAWLESLSVTSAA
jgi:excisionase family DNA binding protein